MNARRSTTVRVSLGVVSLTISLLLLAQLLGVMPDVTKVKLDARQKAVELVAVQVSSAATRNDIRMIQTILASVVERDPHIFSAALRRRGSLMAVAGPHDRLWKPREDGRSTPEQVQVPISKQAREWGRVELVFRPLHSPASLMEWRDSPLAIFAFIGFVGFGFYFLFLRQALNELDPSSVVPEHVRSAFNALAEGVIIIDENEKIVLANQEFANIMQRPSENLVGLRASDLDWMGPNGGDVPDHPWQLAMQDGKAHMGVSLARRGAGDTTRMFVVNGAPVLDGKGRARGALATFDDVSEIEKKNEELEDAMTRLSQSRKAIERKNRELQYLATRDSLTSLLNRRALFEAFEKRFEQSRVDGTPLSALMVDIDHFKAVNDTLGHSVGDRVIKFVAEKMQSLAKPGDLSGRYGGEEFCLVMPGSNIEEAAVLAERLRLLVSTSFRQEFGQDSDLTVSIGVAAMKGAIDTTMDLLNRADKALYAAKSNGRDRVVRWDDPEVEGMADRKPSARLVRKIASGT